jgi:hypothetical protein
MAQPVGWGRREDVAEMDVVLRRRKLCAPFRVGFDDADRGLDSCVIAYASWI